MLVHGYSNFLRYDTPEEMMGIVFSSPFEFRMPSIRLRYRTPKNLNSRRLLFNLNTEIWRMQPLGNVPWWYHLNPRPEGPSDMHVSRWPCNHGALKEDVQSRTCIGRDSGLSDVDNVIALLCYRAQFHGMGPIRHPLINAIPTNAELQYSNIHLCNVLLNFDSKEATGAKICRYGLLCSQYVYHIFGSLNLTELFSSPYWHY